MKPSLQAARDETATLRLVAAARELGERFGVATPAGLQATAKDPAIGALLQREAVADFLEALVGVAAASGQVASGQVGKSARSQWGSTK